MANKIIKIFLLFFLFCIVLDAEANQKVRIVYTNSTNGNIDYCHCLKNPNGGIVKRATVIRRLRSKKDPLFLFDTGDFFTFEKDELLAKYLTRSYKYLQYDGIVPGDQEFTIGVKKFMTYRNDLPFVVNNLLINRGNGFKRVFRRYRIITRKGIKIGVIGTIYNQAFNLYPKAIVSKIRITEQLAEIRKDVAAIKSQNPHLIVLLSHSGFQRDKEIANHVDGIDIIIGGHEQELLREPFYNGKTIIVQAGSNGARIGVLDLSMKGKKIERYKNRFYLPNDKTPEDNNYIRSLIKSYKKEVKSAYKDIQLK